MKPATPKTSQAYVLHVVAALILVLLSTSCSYMGMIKRQKQQESEFEDNPTQKLAVRIAPENVFEVEGTLPVSAGDAPLLITAVVKDTGEQLSARIVTPKLGKYWLYVPAGTYDVLAFADINGDGTYSANEMVGRSGAASPVVVDAAHARDGYVISGPLLAIDRTRPTDAGIAFSATAHRENMIRKSLDDEFFDPKYGEMGLYDPVSLFVHNQGFIFGLEPFDPKKIQVLFVHGVTGTPRDFKYLVEGLDRARYQPWFFYWPTAMPLEKMGHTLTRVIENAITNPQTGSRNLIVVSHSVGGLISEWALRHVGGESYASAIKGYISFSAAYGGSDSARKGVDSAPMVIPSWRDIATGSDFLTTLDKHPFPKIIPFHLFFAWGTADVNGPEQAGDGTISLRSQLDPRMQFTAAHLYGFGESHVGILNNEAARKQFLLALDSLASRDKKPSDAK